MICPKNKGGRKCKYESHVKPYFTEIMEMCKTMTEAQIAERLGVGASTFQDYKTRFPELSEVLKKGRRDLVVELRSSLIKRAHGYDYTESKVVTEEVRWPEDTYVKLLECGFSPEEIKRSRLVKTEVSHKKMAPDVAALNLSLKNYDKYNWANDPQMLEIRKKELELKERQIENNEW